MIVNIGPKGKFCYKLRRVFSRFLSKQVKTSFVKYAQNSLKEVAEEMVWGSKIMVVRHVVWKKCDSLA